MEPVVAVKKNILFLGQPDGGIERIREGVAASVLPQSVPGFVIAKDGPDAAKKIQNQKFDAVVIDVRLPRLREGGCLESLTNHRNVSGAEMMVITPSLDFQLPVDLENVGQILAKPYPIEVLIHALAKGLLTLPLERISSAPAGGTSPYAVDVRVVNALVRSTCYICNQFGVEKIEIKKPLAMAPDAIWQGDVAATIDIRSEIFQGALLLSFECGIYLKLLSNMFGEEQSVIGEKNSDAVGEFSNMILGNAKPDFTHYKVKMSFPKALKKNENPTFPPGSSALVIPAETDFGKIFIKVIAHRSS